MYEEYFKHVNFEITKEIEEFVYNKVLQHSEYVIMRKERGKGKVIAYCTRCNEEFYVDEISHNKLGKCIKCGADVRSKNIRYGRKSLYYRALFYTFEKSLISSKHIVCKAYEVWRDGYQEYRNVKTEYALKAVYIYGEGESVMLENIGWYGWNKRASIFAISNIMSVYSYDFDTVIDFKSFERAAKGTPYQYSMFKEIHTYNPYSHNDYLLKYLELFTKNNLVESIIKVGGIDIIKAKLNKHSSIGALLNLKGNTIYKMLKIDKADLRALTSHGQYLKPSTLKVYQLAKRTKAKLNMDEIKDVELRYGEILYRLEEVSKIVKLDKTYRYLNKQRNKYNNYTTSAGALIEFADYLRDLKILGMDMKDNDLLFPKDLYKAHQNTLVQVEVKRDPEVAALIEKRYKILSKYNFKYKELEIRPIKNIGEIIREGKTLNHCVGRYAKRHANGGTNILLIRKSSNLEEPYFTVEVNKNKVIQVRGMRNCEPTKEVEEFMEKFELIKLSKKIKEVAI